MGYALTAGFLALAIISGYILNIYKLVQHVGEFGAMELARCIGIVAGPLGVVLGFM
jgi:hypothetical protein